ncbi:glycosyltransferase [Fusibacter ferrireducens]|uniref:Glycosyltransferase n=1 Tax=Fusibacter ferrireducens TaxID=2785058 RepID=A0ABR9ZXT4_9FIRM|nr:glycosyltransferase [Fusibacter ferrireducens]MBF4695277.1 glycosyltransferase [Fusibacter ferrireducens]
MNFSVVVPVFNSENTIELMVKKILCFFSEHEMSCEIILVDDCSHDQSWQIIEKVSKMHKEIKGIRLNSNSGQQMAIYQGLHYCEGDYAITIDDDGQHDIEDLIQFMPLISQNYDLIFGIYKSYNDPSYRKRGSGYIGRFFKWRFKNLKGMRVSSFRVVEKSLYQCILNKKKKFVYISAELLPYAQKVGNVAVTRHMRLEGKSGYTLGKLLKLGLNLYFFYGVPHIFNEMNQGKAYDETVVNGWCGELSNQRHPQNEGNGL